MPQKQTSGLYPPPKLPFFHFFFPMSQKILILLTLIPWPGTQAKDGLTLYSQFTTNSVCEIIRMFSSQIYFSVTPVPCRYNSVSSHTWVQWSSKMSLHFTLVFTFNSVSIPNPINPFEIKIWLCQFCMEKPPSGLSSHWVKARVFQVA